MRKGGALALAIAVASALLTLGCGGGGGSAPTSPSPSGGGSGSNVVTITIKGVSGKQSFDPNPATVGPGQVIVYKNNDVVTHHIVLDGTTQQTADIPPGGTSAPISIGTAKTYHCSMHPSMVGSFNGNDTPEPPPCTGYCG